jgi:hypothetical protein
MSRAMAGCRAANRATSAKLPRTVRRRSFITILELDIEGHKMIFESAGSQPDFLNQLSE